MLSCPFDTLRKEDLNSLTIAGQMLGKAVYLACSDPKRLASGVTQRCSQLLDAAQQNPEELSALLLELFATQRINKLMSIGRLVSALNKEKALGKLVVETGRKVGEVKDAVARPIQKMVKEVIERIQWTCHDGKHVPKKNMSWKKIIESTRYRGNAKYKSGINIKKSRN